MKMTIMTPFVAVSDAAAAAAAAHDAPFAFEIMRPPGAARQSRGK